MSLDRDMGRDMGARGVRVLHKQRREILRMRILALVLAVALAASWLLPRGGIQEVRVAGPAATESVTELRSETRLVLQSGEPIVAPREFATEGVAVGDFEFTVRSVCQYRALNFDVAAEVRNTSDELAGGRARLIFRNIDDTWIGASEADLPVIEPGETTTVPFSQTVPCRGDMGSQTVTDVEAELL
ncbi:MAG: hypothetical protein GEU81_10640 [Nitriliruptorales bacterium]|nr:hypothetical protein [Nitriliruptorales bacterium]